LGTYFGTYCGTYGGTHFISDAVKAHFLVLRQLKPQRFIIDAPWYNRNADLHTDLQMEMVTNETGKFAQKHEERLLHHVIVEVIQLLDNSELVRRLKRKETF
jgi:hypothetical protein